MKRNERSGLWVVAIGVLAIMLFYSFIRISYLGRVIAENEVILAETNNFVVELSEILTGTQAGHLVSSINALTLAINLSDSKNEKYKKDALIIMDYESKEVLLTLGKIRIPLSAYENFPLDEFDKNVEIIAKSIQGDDAAGAIRKLYEVAAGVEKFIQKNEQDKKLDKPVPRKKPASSSSSAVTLVASCGV